MVKNRKNDFVRGDANVLPYRRGVKILRHKLKFAEVRIVIPSLVFLALIFACMGCASNVAISGREESHRIVSNSYSSVRYDGCFWKNDFWEEDWNNKKDRRRTLKMVRVRVYPWQSIMAVVTLGAWVPMYLDWEVNGDEK